MPSPVSAADELRLAVGRLSRQLRRIYGSARHEGEPAFLELAILQRLDRTGAVSVSELANGERVTTQAISAVVRELQRRQLVDTSGDPADRRRTLVAANKRGRAVLSEREAQVNERLALAIAAACTAADLRALHSAAPIIERIAEHLG